MPIYSFEYSDSEGIRHVFEELYPRGHDFSAVMSPCGLFVATKIPSGAFHSNSGMTRAEKSAGTTKNRKEVAGFMKEQRRIRQQAYRPGTKEHDSNELWTGNEGRDGVTEAPLPSMRAGGSKFKREI